MPEEASFSIEVDAASVLRRFEQLPNVTRTSILNAMREIVGRLETGVQHNIASEFGTEHRGEPGRPDRASHLHDPDVVLGTVVTEGDSIIGRVSIDLEDIPYARILEVGGTIPEHMISPRGLWLAIPASTFSVPEDLPWDVVFGHQADHPGANIVPYHYMLNVLATYAKVFNNDIELAVVTAIEQLGLE